MGRLSYTMKNSDTFRDNAEDCLHLSERAPNEQTAIRYLRMADAWSSLADQQDWLDGQPSKADQTERATELAEGAIDQLSQDSASTSDIANRKRRLTEGPSEFRDDWIDQSSKRE